MTPYAIGDRVVCLYPSPHVMTVVDIHGGVLKVAAADGSVWCAGDDLLRPAMPRDRHDLERWGRWWWRGLRPVWVEWTLEIGAVWVPAPGWMHGEAVSTFGDWRGPVAPPPEVRS